MHLVWFLHIRSARPACSPIENAAANATLQCTTANDSKFTDGGCADGYCCADSYYRVTQSGSADTCAGRAPWQRHALATQAK